VYYSVVHKVVQYHVLDRPSRQLRPGTTCQPRGVCPVPKITVAITILRSIQDGRRRRECHAENQLGQFRGFFNLASLGGRKNYTQGVIFQGVILHEFSTKIHDSFTLCPVPIGHNPATLFINGEVVDEKFTNCIYIYTYNVCVCVCVCVFVCVYIGPSNLHCQRFVDKGCSWIRARSSS
jgi:hypothetical protein